MTRCSSALAAAYRIFACVAATLVLFAAFASDASASNGAAFVSQSVPAVMAPGQVYPVSVTMQNTGDTTWYAGSLYRLGAQNPQDNNTWGLGRVELPNAVAPGASVTFAFNVTAPAAQGTYNFQWRMVQDLVEWFGDYSTNVAVKDGLNDAAFVSQSVPSPMTPGQTYPVSVTMTNTGNVTWTSASLYRLGAQNPQDNSTWGLLRVELPNSVAPGASVTFNFTITAPSTVGYYNFQWRMVEDLVEWFGDYTPNVSVQDGVNSASFVSASVPAVMTPGQIYPVSVTMTNSGNTTWSASSLYRLGSQSPQDNTTWGLNRVELPNPVPPGGSVTFNFNVTAPTTAATYNFQWRMVEDLIEWFGDYSTSVAVKDGVNDAQFVTQNVPATFAPGQTRSVTVTMQNMGTTTWTAGALYRLGAQNPQDNTTWGLGRVELPGPVAPGANVTFLFNVTAPATVGNYNFQWRMVQDLVEWFGAYSTNVASAVAVPPAAAGNVIKYTYDPAGNIINISRLNPLGLAIASFNPTSGPAGTAVTILGSGFSATPASNTVMFNGAAAVVSVSDLGSIMTTVPASATTGPISVTVGGATATSAQSFIVPPPGTPTITSFTPTSAPAGTTIAVTGTNFNTTAGATTVALNGVSASATVTSTTALTFIVPTGASSGAIAATTSVGTGTSTTDFIVPPPGLATTDIATTLRIAAGGGNTSVVIGTAGKSGLVLFDATAGGFYSLQFKTLVTSPTTASVTYKIIGPDDTVLVTDTIVMSSVATIHLPQIPATGTYTLQLSPGSATLSTNIRLEANSALTLDGAAVATTQDYPGQSTRFTLTAAANQRIGIGALGVSFSPVAAFMTMTLRKPDGSTIGSQTCVGSQSGNAAGNCDYEFQASVAGTYTLTVDSPSIAFTTTSVQISSYAMGTLTADTPQPVTLSRVGQDAAYTFTAAAGDSLGIDLSSAAITPQIDALSVTVLNPDGTVYTQCGTTPPADIYCELGTISTAGTYTVLVDPAHGVYGTFNLTLERGPMLDTVSAPTAFATTGPSESARMRFTASAGQTLTVGIANLAYVGSGGATSLSVNGPNASQIVSGVCLPNAAQPNCRIVAKNLAAGIYSVVLQPPVAVSGNATLSSDVTGTLTAGSAQSTTVSRVGQRAVYTFFGNAGDSTSLEFFGITTTPASQSLTLGVYLSNGTFVNSVSASTSSPSILNFASLPATDTYTVIVDSNAGYTWTGTVELDPGTLVSIDGPTTTLATSVAGQPLRYRFAGTAGQRVEFGIVGLAYSTGFGGTSVSINDPNGNSVASPTCFTSGSANCEATIASLPSTGTYSIVLQPPNPISSGTMALSSSLTGTFVVDNPAQTVAITRPGQTARYTFSGTAAQNLRINWSSATVLGGNSVQVTVLNPDGSTLSSSSFADGNTGGFDVPSLPTTGTYTVVFDPSQGATMSASLSLVTR